MEISRRSSVALREIWPLETDFSDWLVSEDGIEMIAEDIGITIEGPRRECRPGDFPCDVVARVQGDESHVVIIENQFGKTNHDHLGKLISYAAVNNATTAIWISETISDDHSKAIDWLNGNTPSNINFYLARIHAYRIGNSPAAPLLDVVCRPNFSAKVLKESRADTEIKVLWKEILDYLDENKPPFRVPAPSNTHYIRIALDPKDNFCIYIAFLKNKITCDFTIKVPWRYDALSQLESEREKIEAEIGQSLEWVHLNTWSRIKAQTNIDLSQPDSKQFVKQWVLDKSLAFYNAFAPRVQHLQPSTNTHPGESE